MKKIFTLIAAMVLSLGAFAQDVKPIYTEVEPGVFAVTMTNEEIAAAYPEEWCSVVWNIGVKLPAGTVMGGNADITICAANDVPVYTTNNKFGDMHKEFPAYNGYVNLGCSLPQSGWTGEETIADIPTVNNHGVIAVTPTKDGILRFGVYAGDNTRVIGVYDWPSDEEYAEGYAGKMIAFNEFRNDGENGTVKGAAGYVEAELKAGRTYFLLGGGNKNLTMHQISFVATPAKIYSEVEPGVFAVTMTNEEIAAAYPEEWCSVVWNIGVKLPAGTVMGGNADITICAANDVPVYTTNNKFGDMHKEFPAYNGYVNLGCSLPQSGWTGEETIADIPTVNNHGVIAVAPKKDGVIRFGVYAGDNTRVIGVYDWPSDEEYAEGYAGKMIAFNEFRNDGENGTVKGAPGYVEAEVKAGRTYFLLGGGNKNLTMHQISFREGSLEPASTEISELIAGQETLNLKAGKEYTLNAPAVAEALKVVTINANGATIKVGAEGQFVAQAGIIINDAIIDASESPLAPVALSATPDASLYTYTPAEGDTPESYKYEGANQKVYESETVQYNNCTVITAAPLFNAGTAAWALKDLTVNNTIVEVKYKSGKAIIDVEEGANSIKDITVKNSTIYADDAATDMRFIRYTNASNAQAQKVWGTTGTSSFTIENSTFVNVCGNKEFANNYVNKNNTTLTWKNNLFANVWRLNKIGGNNVRNFAQAENMVSGGTNDVDGTDAGWFTSVADLGIVWNYAEAGAPAATDNIEALGAIFAPYKDYATFGDPRWAPYAKENTSGIHSVTTEAVSAVKKYIGKNGIVIEKNGQLFNVAGSMIK